MLNAVVLHGREVRLEPLSASHFQALCAVGVDEELWRWMPTRVRTSQELTAWCEGALEEQRKGMALPWAIVRCSIAALRLAGPGSPAPGRERG